MDEMNQTPVTLGFHLAVVRNGGFNELIHVGKIDNILYF